MGITVHAFQGRTVDTVIAAMEAKHPHLTTQKTLYVEISRARDRAELVTDDRNALRERVEAVTKAFCFEIDLLTLKEHEDGRDPLEQVFFGDIDTKGAVARQLLLEEGPASLDNEQRCNFARLLLSLEARRPTVVQRLREGRSFLANAIDNDPEIIDEIEAEGLSGSPSALLAGLGISLEDRALGNIQGLVDNPKVGDRLINSHWRLVRLGPCEGTLVLSDRPLVRLFGYEHPKASWFLPLGPKVMFYAARKPSDFERLTPRRLAKSLNVSSAGQAQKYVFCVENSHTDWLGKHLNSRSEWG